MYWTQLALEIGVVAFSTAGSLLLALKLNGPITTSKDALWIGGILGAIIHVLFELSGANASYCSIGAACSS